MLYSAYNVWPLTRPSGRQSISLIGSVTGKYIFKMFLVVGTWASRFLIINKLGIYRVVGSMVGCGIGNNQGVFFLCVWLRENKYQEAPISDRFSENNVLYILLMLLQNQILTQGKKHYIEAMSDGFTLCLCCFLALFFLELATFFVG